MCVCVCAQVCSIYGLFETCIIVYNMCWKGVFYVDYIGLMSSVMGRCGICEKAEAKYRCPGCLVRTCSLRCVLRHKTDRHCNGQRIKTAYVGIKDFTDANLRSGKFNT